MHFDLSEKYNVTLSYTPFILKPFSLNNCVKSEEVSRNVLRNILFRETEFNTKLSVHLTTRDFFASFQKDLKTGPQKYFVNGSVNYSNDYVGVLPTDLDLEKELSVERHIYDTGSNLEHNWFFPSHKIQNHIISRWETSKIEQELEVTLGPKQCAIAKLTIDICKDFKIPYENTGFFTARNSLGEVVRDVYLMSLAKEIFKENLNLEFANPGQSSIKFLTTDFITHDVIRDAQVMLVGCNE